MQRIEHAKPATASSSSTGRYVTTANQKLRMESAGVMCTPASLKTNRAKSTKYAEALSHKATTSVKQANSQIPPLLDQETLNEIANDAAATVGGLQQKAKPLTNLANKLKNRLQGFGQSKRSQEDTSSESDSNQAQRPSTDDAPTLVTNIPSSLDDEFNNHSEDVLMTDTHQIPSRKPTSSKQTTARITSNANINELTPKTEESDDESSSESSDDSCALCTPKLPLGRNIVHSSDSHTDESDMESPLRPAPRRSSRIIESDESEAEDSARLLKCSTSIFENSPSICRQSGRKSRDYIS